MAEIEVGARYALRTFKPRRVLGEPYLTTVSQDPIGADSAVPKKWRHVLLDQGVVQLSWADGTCTAVCQRYHPGGFYDDDELARHKTEVHDVPVKDCTCGIYGLDDLKDLYDQYRTETSAFVAVIACSGRTIEYNKGVKTAYARVVAYWVLDHPQKCTCVMCSRRSNTDKAFPYLECCAKQFEPHAQRFDEPDAMALHYGLKATPLIPAMRPQRVTTFPKAGPVVQPPLFPPPGARGHITFEIPVS